MIYLTLNLDFKVPGLF